VVKRIINLINQQNILCNKQFGFCARHSTLNVIPSITDKIQKAIENGYYSCSINLSKAFDTVNHHIYVLDWFKSYLTNRKQFVSLRNVHLYFSIFPVEFDKVRFLDLFSFAIC
jgi:hypothetical protein